MLDGDSIVGGCRSFKVLATDSPAQSKVEMAFWHCERAEGDANNRVIPPGALFGKRSEEL